MPNQQTQAELLDELIQLRQQVATLETTTTDQARQLATEREQRRLATALLNANTVISSSLDYDTILTGIVEQIASIVDYEAAAILQRDGDDIRILRWQEKAAAPPSALCFPTSEMPLLAEQWTETARFISAVTPDDRWIHTVDKPWIKSYLGLLIKMDEATVGLLLLVSDIPAFFGQAEADSGQAFVDQAGVALRNATLYQQARAEIDLQVEALKQERNFVSAVLNTAGALVMVIDVEGCILRFNRACQETTGHTFKEVKGHPFWDLFLPPEDVGPMQNLFRALREGEPIPDTYENYWLTKDRRRRLIAWTNTVLTDRSGRIEYVISTGIDITEAKQLEDRLVAIHQLGRELNLLRDEIAIWDIALETSAFLLEFKSAGYGIVQDGVEALDYYYQPVRGVPTTVRLKLPPSTKERINQLKTYRAENIPAETDPAPGESRWLNAPMRVGERLIGVLDIEIDAANYITADDQQLLQTLADQTAVAIENARLHQEARQRVDELTTMNMISQAITSSLNLQETLTIITDHSIRLLGSMAASVVLSDEVRGQMWFHAASGGSSEFVRGKRLPAGQGIVGWVINNSEPVLVADVSADKRFFADFDKQTGFRTESVICTPLRTGAQTIGAIEVLNKKNGAFTPEDLQLLSWLATPAATAIENARLFEAEHAAREQAEILREATATLTSTLDLDRVLNSILVHLEQVVAYDNSNVFLQEDEWLEVVAGRDHSPEDAADGEAQYPADNPLYREIRETSRPVIVPNAQDDARFKLWDLGTNTRGWMGVPLMVRSQVIGCLTLSSQEINSYGATEAKLAQAFANQATVAIQNARLFKEVRLGRERLRSLSQRLVEIQETERRHIARELHDEAGQSLSSLMVGLRLLEREVDNPDTLMEGIINLKQMTNDVSENLHRLAIHLRPASLDHLGLVAALRQHIEEFGRQNGLTTQFEAVGMEDKRFPPTVETNIYRIVQEAMTNVVRHAKATRIDVLLEKRGDQVVAIIEDNGVGFDAEAAGQSSRLGLLGMRERAEMLKGDLMIESSMGAGTTIYVEVPYDHSDSHR